MLVPYELLDSGRRAAMDRFAAIGTLGLSGGEQYAEVFNNLLVAHELGHWLQHLARRPLSRWQAEHGANRVMVAFWRNHPDRTRIAGTDLRLANFVAQSPAMPAPLPPDAGMSAEDYFNTHSAQIEANPVAYAGFQKLMVRQAIAEQPRPDFSDVLAQTWPN